MIVNNEYILLMYYIMYDIIYTCYKLVVIYF